MSDLNDRTREQVVDLELRQAVDNTQNRFLERMARGLSLRELSEELIVEALDLSDASYGCVLRTDDKGLLVLDAVVSIAADGSVLRPKDTLLDNRPDQVIRDIIGVLKPTFSNNPTDITLKNLPRSHPQCRCFAICPLHEHGNLKALLIVTNARRQFDLELVKRLQSMLETFIGVPINSIVNRRIHNVIATVSEANKLYPNLLQASFNAILSVNDELMITAFNPACEQLFSIDKTKALGQSLEHFVDNDTLRTIRNNAANYSYMLSCNNTSPYSIDDVFAIKSNTQKTAVKLNVFHSLVNEIANTTLLFQTKVQNDIEQPSVHFDHHDPLTGLPNRMCFIGQLHHVLDQRGINDVVCVLFINLDGFKAVNDTMGHLVGDELLRQVAMRLRQNTRNGDTVARLGGDEFTVTLNNLDQANEAGDVAEKILQVLKQPFHLRHEEVYVSASIGIATALSTDTAVDAQGLIKQADVALNRAKLSGRSRHVFFTPELDEAQRNRSILITSLRRAVDRQDFELFYQPQLLIKDNRLLGFEALLRWPQSSGKAINPNAFIDVLEETGLIGELGEWAISSACEQHMKWLRSGLIGPATTMSVNVSARQLGIPHFADRVAAILDKHSMRPDSLILEITESALVQNIESDIIKQIKALGIQISLDDFGTGYSSLAYLSQLPLDHLKIDRSFIADIHRFPHAVTVVKSIIALANTLGIRVIAEGVESAGVLPLLASEGCEGYQGFYFSEPIPAKLMQAKLNKLEKVRLSHYAYFINLGDSATV